MGHAPFTVDDDRKRKGCEPISQRSGEIERIIAAYQRRIIQVEFPRELVDFVPLIHGNADKLQALRPQLPLGLNELGHLLPARLAPCRPEINDEHLASPLIQRLLRSLSVWKGERKQWGRVPRLALPNCHAD